MAVVKTAISLDEELLRRVDALARELDEPRSRVLARAAEELLRKLETQHLLERLRHAYGGEDEASEADERLKELRRTRHRQLVDGEW